MHIELPVNYENSITSTQLQKQELLLREQDQIATKIRAETSVIQAEFEKRIKVILANGKANYTIETKEAHAVATQRKIGIHSMVLSSLRAALGLPAELLLDYQTYASVDEMEGASLYYGFGGPSMLSKNAPSRILEVAGATLESAANLT